MNSQISLTLVALLAIAVAVFAGSSGLAKNDLPANADATAHRFSPATGDGARIVAIRPAWHIAEEENGKVFLRATLTGDKGKPDWKTWHGELRTPLIPVAWGDGNQSIQ